MAGAYEIGITDAHGRALRDNGIYGVNTAASVHKLTGSERRAQDDRTDHRDVVRVPLPPAPSFPAASRTLAVALFCAAISGLVACQASSPAAERKANAVAAAPPPEAAEAAAGPGDKPADRPAEPEYPALNPAPKHTVRIHGRLPAHLRMALYHRYIVDSLDEACAPLGGRGTLVIPIKQGLTERAKIRHEGDRFETELVVDKYLPGECGWKYIESRARFWKDTASEEDSSGPGDTMPSIPVLDGSRYHVADSVPRCRQPPRKDGRGCQEARYWRLSNYDESIPVLVRCKIRKSEAFMDMPESWYFGCDDLANDSHKKDHLIMPFTKQVELNVYDLDVDADPAPLPRKESNP